MTVLNTKNLVILAIIGLLSFIGYNIYGEKDAYHINENEIYMFYQPTCPHCHTASGYIARKHPDISIRMENIQQNPESRKLFEKCAEKFNIDKRELGTPLICMGNNYILGWSKNAGIQFDSYLARMKK